MVRPIDNHSVMWLIDLANLGLDGDCRIEADEYLALLAKALALPVQGDINRLKLLMYKAHYEWRQNRWHEAIATLDEAHRVVSEDPVPLFLASEWLVELGDIEGANNYYARAVAISEDLLMDYSFFIESVGKRLVDASSHTKQ
jgi:tetratricopeptide (TPR) repeat protein